MSQDAHFSGQHLAPARVARCQTSPTQEFRVFLGTQLQLVGAPLTLVQVLLVAQGLSAMVVPLTAMFRILMSLEVPAILSCPEFAIRLC